MIADVPTSARVTGGGSGSSESPRYSIGLCGALALDAAKSWHWTSDQWDALFVFGHLWRDLLPRIDLGRRVVQSGDAELKRRAYELIKPSRDRMHAAFKNWQPTDKEWERPN